MWVKSSKKRIDYYPFGLKHTNYNTTVLKLRGGNTLPLPANAPAIYKYRFQSQERQDEFGLNWDAFKWRNYDYAIGRFMSLDKLAEDYSYQSPYNFAENRVMDGRELEGLEWRSSTSSDGKTVSLTLSVKTINNTSGIISNKEMANLANQRASQLSSSLGGTDSQGRTVNVSVEYNDKATISWEYTQVNDTSHKTYSNDSAGESEQMGDAMAFGLTDKIGDTQNNRTQVNVSSIAESTGRVYNKTLEKWQDSPTATKERANEAKKTGVHEDGHALGGRHQKENDPANINPNQGSNPNHLMNDSSTGAQLTPNDKSAMIKTIEVQQPK